MNTQPFLTAAKTWIEQISKTHKLTKAVKRAVLSFGMWMDELIRKQDEAERIKNGKEN